MSKALFKSFIIGFGLFSLCLVTPPSAHAAYVQRAGTLSMLRVHDVGTGYGPGSDFIDVEVVLAFSNEPGKAYGFKLRSDGNALVHQAMLDLLRDAFENDWNVVINVEIPTGKNHGVLNRVWVTR